MGATKYISKGEINKISTFISEIVGKYPIPGDSPITLSRKERIFVPLSGQILDLEDTEGNPLENAFVNKQDNKMHKRAQYSFSTTALSHCKFLISC